VLTRPELRIRKGLRQQVLQLIRSDSQTVTPSRPLQISPDPDDNIFLECADAARADYFVTGNPRHFQFWKISSPEFLGMAARASSLEQRLMGSASASVEDSV